MGVVAQTLFGKKLNAATGSGAIVTVIVSVRVQPSLSVMVKEYVVVVSGVAIGFGQAVQESPVAGVQLYAIGAVPVTFAIAPKSTALPRQIVVSVSNESEHCALE